MVSEYGEYGKEGQRRLGLGRKFDFALVASCKAFTCIEYGSQQFHAESPSSLHQFWAGKLLDNPCSALSSHDQGPEVLGSGCCWLGCGWGTHDEARKRLVRVLLGRVGLGWIDSLEHHVSVPIGASEQLGIAVCVGTCASASTTTACCVGGSNDNVTV